MNDRMKELAARAVAAAQWRWLPGMLMRDGNEWARVYAVDDDVWIVTWEDETDTMCSADAPMARPGSDWFVRAASRRALPDFDDPATVGCLERLACVAWRADYIHVRVPIAPDMAGPRAWWAACDYRGHRRGSGEVRGACPRVSCLVAALETAP